MINTLGKSPLLLITEKENILRPPTYNFKNVNISIKIYNIKHKNYNELTELTWWFRHNNDGGNQV